MHFKDHFSQQAAAYSRYRPLYPQALFAYLADQVRQHDLAWDCGTGSGQTAWALTEFFTTVIATDPSERQLASAIAHSRIVYRAAAVEQSGLEAGTVDLITVAQALHWFDLDRFYAEVRRVLRPGGVLAVWCYGLAQVTPAVDRVIKRLYSAIVGPYWPPERRQVETAYRDLPFPFAEWQPPEFAMTATWSLEQYLGYLGTWSAVQAYRRQQGGDPLALIRDELTRAWGDPALPRPIRWPLSVRLGRWMGDTR